jgi:Tol biopolymer transport system component
MALPTGSSLGAYEIVSPLGSGGMGEVYRARDRKLGREVAIKVLPEAVERDPDRIARFEREARVLASLNHPHIAALYGMELAGDRHFLIMELVEGETLADRVRRGPIPVEDALRIATQIADALEAAHEKGIVHRDLKPANIKLAPDDTVKVLDFGLAKAMELEPRPGADATHSPTLSLMATQAGMILGTAAYMSPEQAKGLPADHRSDVFSFGSVLYEMLTGRPPFQGDTAPDILASVLVREPALAALPANLNPRLTDLLKRCLDKNPKRRWQAVGDLRAELQAIAASPWSVAASVAAIAPPRPLWRHVLPAVASAIAAGVLASAATMYLGPSPAPPVVTRFPITLGEGQAIAAPATRQAVAISPDGTLMAYTANPRIYLRSMSELEARPIAADTGGGFLGSPVFSPDARSVAFWSSTDQTLKKMAVSGGAAVTICPAEQPLGMSWGPAGIVFGQDKGIMRVSANGGTPEVLVSVNDGEEAYGPQILPDGETVLFTLATGTAPERWDTAQIVAQSLKSGARKTLVTGGSDGRYVPTGHLVYALRGIVFAVPMDVGRIEVTGGPVPIIEGVRRASGNVTAASQLDFSSTGSLMYMQGPVSSIAGQSDLALIDRKGGAEPLKLPPGQYQHPRASPDGKQMAFGSDDGKEAIVWVYERGGTTSMRRLTFGGRNRFPIWSADGQRIAFQSDREGDLGIFWQRADGSGAAERLTKPDKGTSHVPESWSPGGDRFLFGVTNGSNVSLWLFSLQDRRATPFVDVQSPNPINSTFSPDGRWIAYSVLERDVTGIYVQPFPATGAKYQVSKARAVHPVWSRDGRELVTQPQGGQPFVVQTITTQPSFAFSAPMPVPRGGALGLGPAFQRNYDVMPDGRILGVVNSAQVQSAGPATQQIQVVLNWFEELKARVPTP